MGSARARVLEALDGAQRPVTAAELARSLGAHENTVRDHLDVLQQDGYATRERRPSQGPGRPAWCYRAVPGADDSARQVQEYASLAKVLAGQLVRGSLDPAADSLAAGETWGRELAEGEPTTTPAEARRRVVTLLDDLGFDPVANSRATRIRLRRCPLLEAARSRPDVVCRVHLGMVRGVLTTLGGQPSGSRLDSFAEPGACRLVLSSHPSIDSGALLS
jgi:predicted ArsR family transcriptional regulator